LLGKYFAMSVIVNGDGEKKPGTYGLRLPRVVRD